MSRGHRRERAELDSSLPQSGKVVLFIGTVLPYRGLLTLLRALPHSRVAEPPLNRPGFVGGSNP